MNQAKFKSNQIKSMPFLPSGPLLRHNAGHSKQEAKQALEN
jgi:hypothetical protein